jgi:glycosyltransferase involved in cell wall biosynthesis
VGRINRDKGIDELFSAYKSVASERDHTVLLLVGRMENEELLQQDLLEWSRQDPRVIFCGQTNEVEKYMSAMDVYVLPSYREGFGSAVVEAEAMGVPVIVSDIPGPTDAMRRDETGLVVKKADVETLRDAMLRLYDDAELRQCMGEAAFRFALEHFEQTQLAEHILQDRKRLLSK